MFKVRVRGKKGHTLSTGPSLVIDSFRAESMIQISLLAVGKAHGGFKDKQLRSAPPARNKGC